MNKIWLGKCSNSTNTLAPLRFLVCVRRPRETQAEVSGSPEGHAVGHSCLYTTHTGARRVRFSTPFALAW